MKNNAIGISLTSSSLSSVVNISPDVHWISSLCGSEDAATSWRSRMLKKKMDQVKEMEIVVEPCRDYHDKIR